MHLQIKPFYQGDFGDDRADTRNYKAKKDKYFKVKKVQVLETTPKTHRRISKV